MRPVSANGLVWLHVWFTEIENRVSACLFTHPCEQTSFELKKKNKFNSMNKGYLHTVLKASFLFSSCLLEGDMAGH